MPSGVEKEPMEHQDSIQQDAHLDRLLMSTDIEEPWYKSIGRSIRETVSPERLPPLELTSKPALDGEFGDLAALELPWYKSLIANVKELINPPKLPPLQVTSKPVEVGTIWGAYGGGEKRSGLVSLLIHAGVIGLMLLIFRAPGVQEKLKKVTDIYFPVNAYKPKLPPAKEKAGGGGGGGNKAPTPVARGEAPKQAPKTFIPPMQAIPHPQLPVVPTITAPTPQIVADNYGDPLSKLNDNSAGQGVNGFGNGKGNGVGNGNGDGYGDGSGGGTGGGTFRAGGEVSSPVLISKVEPEYSEEARKAKFSGTVLLSVVVDEHGIPQEIHVTRPLGLGLDEKAIEAVQHWRFRPGVRNGKPVRVRASIEVSFRLL